MKYDLLAPITEDGIRNSNFFNGRVLSAEALRREQDANRRQRQQLGQALGPGVVTGLEVSLGTTTGLQPTVKVTEGLALNRLGQTLALPDDAEVALVKSKDAAAIDAGLFAPCSIGGTAPTHSGAAVYILTVAPASGYSVEKAAKHGLVGNGVASECGFRDAIEGVQFRLIHVDVNEPAVVGSASAVTLVTALLGVTSDAGQSRLRNILAHLCLGAAGGLQTGVDPFEGTDPVSGPAGQGLTQNLYQLGRLNACEVPLALIYWDQSALRFADNWAVRRLIRGGHDLNVPPLLFGPGPERQYQFQEHMQSLIAAHGNLMGIKAQDYFRFLPPVSYYPAHGAGLLTDYATTTLQEFGAGSFAKKLHHSYSYPAVDLDQKVVFQLYTVRENQGAAQQVQVFVSRTLHDTPVQDGVAGVLVGARIAYQALYRRRLPESADTDPTAFFLQIGTIFAIRDVMELALNLATLAQSGSLDTKAALQSFKDMLNNQAGVANSLGGSFKEGMAELLTGNQGLSKALEQRDLIAAVNAQYKINTYVSHFGAGKVGGKVGAPGSGPIAGGDRDPGSFGIRDAKDFGNIELGAGTDEASRFDFTLYNDSDEPITLNLKAEVEAATGDWGESTIVHLAERESVMGFEELIIGEEIQEIILLPGEEKQVAVMVNAPADAALDENIVLNFKTTAPALADEPERIITYDRITVGERTIQPRFGLG